MPPQVRVINSLLTAETEAEQRRIIRENRDIITPEFVQMLDALADQVSEDGQSEEMVGQIRKLKAMVEANV